MVSLLGLLGLFARDRCLVLRSESLFAAAVAAECFFYFFFF